MSEALKVAILGPTASGKSALAVEVARRLGGAVVNGDPFQAYRGLAIGTGQPEPADQDGVPHLGYGVLPLDHRLHPAAFGAMVRSWMDATPRPVLVTGSGLYLRGIWDQLTDLPEVPEALVARVRRWTRLLGAPFLHRYLSAVDPLRAAQLHPNDQARLERALALHLATGRPPSRLLDGVSREAPSGWRVLRVQPARERQRERVASRVQAMLEQGWRREVEGLVEAGLESELRSLRPLGYDTLLEGGRGARQRIILDTQAYAKRQATWFRNQLPGVPSWDPDEEGVDSALEKLGLLDHLPV